MNYFSKTFKGVCIALFVWLGINKHMQGMDVPLFSKPTLHKGIAKKSSEKWAAMVTIGFGQGSNSQGWNGDSNKGNILDLYGITDITRLGLGMQSTAGKAVTSQYWNSSNNGSFDVASSGINIGLTPGAGNIALSGKLATAQFDVSYEQNFFSGFFMQAYLPVRHVRVSDITYKSLIPSDTIAGTSIGLSNFMANTLPTILLENGYSSDWQSGYSKTVAPDLLLLLGWQGNNAESFGVIDEASGRVQIGLIMPLAGRTDQNTLFALPLGYDGFWGVHTRFELEVGIWKILALGVQAGSSIFMSDSRTQRLYTDNMQLQRGWITFEKNKVSVNKGSVWDLNSYLKVHNFFGGLTGQLGLSYNRQEDTQLHLPADSTVLNRVTTTYAALTPSQSLSANTIVNVDDRLKAWDQASVSLIIGYDFRKHASAGDYAPVFTVELACPFAGKRSAAMNYIAGSLSLDF